MTAKAERRRWRSCATRSSSRPRGRGELLPHRELHLAVATLAALRGEDVSWLAGAVSDELAGERLPVSGHDRWLFAGAGRDWPTAQEAALKLREGVYLAAEAYQLEELLHGHLAAVDENVRCFVFEGEGRAAARAAETVAALARARLRRRRSCRRGTRSSTSSASSC